MVMRTNAVLALGLGLVLALGAVGCRVENHQDGKNNDVKIATPFGGMSVKTNNSDVQSSVGMAAYPGATVVSKNDDSDNGAADVNLSFGNFHLGVKAVSYRTTDAPDKVLAFYRKDMARYGAVILCRNSQAVGTPVKTQDGLGCSDSGNTHTSDSDGKVGTLKAGSRQHQHLVTVDAEGTGSKFGLVALDLPGHAGDGDGQ